MFEYLPGGDDHIIAVKATGVLREVDYETFFPNLEDAIADRAPVRVLADWEGLDGWQGEASWYSFWFRVTNRHAFERIAVIADEKWRNEVAKIGVIIDRGEVRLFSPSQREAAWAWLKEGEPLSTACERA